MEDISHETKSGKFYAYSQAELLTAHSLQLYADYKSGSLISSSEGVEKYSRRELTERMSEIIKSI
jgi:hypothetical protein